MTAFDLVEFFHDFEVVKTKLPQGLEHHLFVIIDLLHDILNYLNNFLVFATKQAALFFFLLVLLQMLVLLAHNFSFNFYLLGKDSLLEKLIIDVLLVRMILGTFEAKIDSTFAVVVVAEVGQRKTVLETPGLFELHLHE
jgi:hypothetical protein